MALVEGSLQGRLSLVRSMLERGADVNFVDDDGFTALCVASQEGHLEIVDVLVAAGALVNWARKEDGGTALFMASAEWAPRGRSQPCPSRSRR
jgi:ankyrin repeat protein